MEKLLRLQKWAIRTILRLGRQTSCREKFKDLRIMTFPSLYAYNACTFIHDKILGGELKRNKDVHTYGTRKSNDIYIDYKSSKKTMNTIFRIMRIILTLYNQCGERRLR